MEQSNNPPAKLSVELTPENIAAIVNKRDITRGPDPYPGAGRPDEMKVRIPFTGCYDSVIVDECNKTIEREKEYWTDVLRGLTDIPVTEDDIEEAGKSYEMDMEYCYDTWVDALFGELETWTNIVFDQPHYASVWHPRQHNFDTDHMYVWVKKSDMRTLIDYILNDPELHKDLDERIKEAQGDYPFDIDWSKDDIDPEWYAYVFEAAIPDWVYNVENRYSDRFGTEDAFYPIGSLQVHYDRELVSFPERYINTKNKNTTNQ